MKKLLFIAVTFLCGMTANAQMYISLSNTFYNSGGTFGEKCSPAVEVGKQFGPLSLGFDVGLTNCGNGKTKDTTNQTPLLGTGIHAMYFEVRPNINVFQQGKFTNTLTIGTGICPFTSQYFMTEFSSGIEYAYSEILHININFGQYYYSGKYSSNYSNAPSFIGLNIIYYLKPFKVN